MAEKLLEKTVIEPNLTETLEILKQDIFATLNAVKVGQIQSFDPSDKTAEVQLLFKRILSDGTEMSHPVLVDCPVFTLQGGGAFVQFPIQAGDQCLVLFSDRNLDAWFAEGTEQVPYDQRTHDFSDAIALVGLNAQTSSMPDYIANQVTFQYAGSLITMTGSIITIKQGTTSVIQITPSQISLTQGLTTTVVLTPTQLTLTEGASTITLTSAQIVISGGGTVMTLSGGNLAMTDTGGAQLQMNGGLLKIANATTTLLTLLDGLISVIAAATVQDGSAVLPLTSSTIAALNAYKTQLGGLLQ